LLGDINSNKEGTGDFNDIFKSRDLKGRMGSTDKELEIKFNVGFGEDIGQKLIKEKKERAEEDEEGGW
jgi:hypothetical protein